MSSVPFRPLFPFSPRWFLAGLVLAFLVLALAGRWAGRRPYHRDFTRFSPQISPEGSYYPTVGEMCSIVRSQCRPDQVLVIVGGNSIFFGVGQPRDVMWSRRLQEILGPHYCVVNFAFRGSYPLDGGAVIAEVLRNEYPRQLYIANTGPLQPAEAIGSESFRFLFWEAYFKGMLEPNAARSERVRDYLFKSPYERHSSWELVLVPQLDRVLRFRDFWNFVGYKYAFTIMSPNASSLHDALQPKRVYPDNEDDGRLIPFDRRFRKEVWDAEMRIVRGFSEVYYEEQSDHSWILRPGVKENFMNYAKSSMPAHLRSRTLIVLSKNSPFYLRRLTPAEKSRDDFAYRDSIALWEEAGFAAMTYGSMDDQDFLDRTHLMPSGGQKLAADVAQKVRAMAVSLKYLNDTNP